MTQMTGLSEFNISVISSELDFFVPYRILNRAIAFFIVLEHIFLAFDAELVSGGRTIFESQWAGVLLFSPGQITPQCHSEQCCQ